MIILTISACSPISFLSRSVRGGRLGWLVGKVGNGTGSKREGSGGRDY